MSNVITIRETTEKERNDGRRHNFRLYKYVVVMKENPDQYCMSYGILANTARSKSEVLFWAERWASNWGAILERPTGWEKVRARLGNTE